MNLSKIKVRISNILVKVGNKCITNNNYFYKSVFNLLVIVVDYIFHFQLYQIKTVKDFCLSNGFDYRTLVTDRVGYSWTSASNLNGMRSHEVKMDLPDITLSKLQDVAIISNSDLIISKQANIVINDYCASNNDDNKTYVDGITLAYWRQCCLLNRPTSQQHISRGIMLSGKFSFNYYHNVYENLIRLLLVKDFDNIIPKDVPLIIDEEVLRYDSLKTIFEHFRSKTDRSYICIKRNIEYNINELYYFSSVNQLTPQHIKPYIQKPEDFLFDRYYILRYSRDLLSLKSKTDYPRRIFISRVNIKKRNFNEDEVYEVLKPFGFVKIAPETLSFEEQIKLFNGAEYIIGGSGAAFTNMLFSNKKCKAIIIIGRRGMPSSCFNGPAYINGASISFYQSSEKFDKGIHEDFSVDISKFSSFINEYMRPLNN